MSRPSGILLAGGASRRFGRPKLVEPIDGAPLFHRPLRALMDCCEDVVVVLGPDGPEPPLPDAADHVSFARDDVAYHGPLAGTRAGLERVRAEYAVVLAADMPGVSAPLLSLMADRASSDGANATVLRDAEDMRPLPAVIRVAPASTLARRLLDSGERRLRALVLGLEPQVLPEAVWSVADRNGSWRHDIDLPADLRSWTR